MKLFVVLTLLTVAFNSFAEGKPVRKSPVLDKLGIKPEPPLAKTAAQKQADAKMNQKPEDCDTKAKKPVEIKAETISLSGNTGCSLDEIK